MKLAIYIFLACLFVMTGCRADPQDSDSKVELNLMTFNVRYDNPDDGANNWKFRKGFVADIINKLKQ